MAVLTMLPFTHLLIYFNAVALPFWVFQPLVAGALETPYDKLVVNAWAWDLNSKIMTTDLGRQLSNLNGKNISDVVATDLAFAVRIANDEEEAAQAAQRFRGKGGHDAHHKPIADGERKAATWVVWGEFQEAQGINQTYNDDKNWGGKASAEAIEALRAADTWPADIAEIGRTVGHVVYANDICPLKNAFVAILKGKVACWGSQATCEGKHICITRI